MCNRQQVGEGAMDAQVRQDSPPPLRCLMLKWKASSGRQSFIPEHQTESKLLGLPLFADSKAKTQATTNDAACELLEIWDRSVKLKNSILQLFLPSMMVYSKELLNLLKNVWEENCFIWHAALIFWKQLLAPPVWLHS